MDNIDLMYFNNYLKYQIGNNYDNNQQRQYYNNVRNDTNTNYYTPILYNNNDIKDRSNDNDNDNGDDINMKNTKNYLNASLCLQHKTNKPFIFPTFMLNNQPDSSVRKSYKSERRFISAEGFKLVSTDKTSLLDKPTVIFTATVNLVKVPSDPSIIIKSNYEDWQIADGLKGPNVGVWNSTEKEITFKGLYISE